MFRLFFIVVILVSGCASSFDKDAPVLAETRSTTIECPLEFRDLAFTEIGLFDGYPNENVKILPTNVKSTLSHNWNITCNDLWVVCSYGPTSKRLIQKRITMEVRSCGTEESKIGSGQYNLLNCL